MPDVTVDCIARCWVFQTRQVFCGEWTKTSSQDLYYTFLKSMTKKVITLASNLQIRRCGDGNSRKVLTRMVLHVADQENDLDLIVKSKSFAYWAQTHGRESMLLFITNLWQDAFILTWAGDRTSWLKPWFTKLILGLRSKNVWNYSKQFLWVISPQPMAILWWWEEEENKRLRPQALCKVDKTDFSVYSSWITVGWRPPLRTGLDSCVDTSINCLSRLCPRR